MAHLIVTRSTSQSEDTSESTNKRATKSGYSCPMLREHHFDEDDTTEEGNRDTVAEAHGLSLSKISQVIPHISRARMGR